MTSSVSTGGLALEHLLLGAWVAGGGPLRDARQAGQRIHALADPHKRLIRRQCLACTITTSSVLDQSAR